MNSATFTHSRTMSDTMDACTTLLFLVAFCVICLYITINKNLNYFKNKGIPYVPGWPLLGNMAATFFRKEHVSETIVRIYNEHRDAKYIGVFDFMQPVFMLRERDLIKSITIKNSDSFLDRWSFVDHKLDPFFGGNLLTMTGERWKQSRALLSPAFTSSKIKVMFELIVPCARNVVDYLSELSDNAKNMLDTREFFSRYATDVIATCAFGIKVNSVNNLKNDFYTMGKNAANLSGIMTIKFFIARSFPNIVKWLNIKFFDDRVVNFFESIIGNTVDTRDTEGISRPDIVQLMMNARCSSKEYKLDVPEITAQAFMFFFGGFDSTTTQLCVIAHELAIDPEVQKKLHKEIDEVMDKSGGKPSYDDIKRMSYLDAVFSESLRKHPQASVLDRICTKRFELPAALPGCDPIIVKPGTRIWIPAAAIHKNPDYFDDPETFNPDRYYDNKKISVNEVTNLGFGIGPRSCIGYRFALLEIKILLVYLLSRFELMPNGKTCKPLKYSNSTLSISAEGGFCLAIKPRS